MIKTILKKGEYFNSVTLMFIAEKISEIASVTDSAVVSDIKSKNL